MKMWLLAAVLGAPLILGAQTTRVPAAQSEFVEQGRQGTARYRSVDAAIADGYKRVGVEFPAMGEHWVNLARVLENRFDPRTPAVLIYVTKNGKRELAGVAYTALLTGAEKPPKTVAAASDWHEHNGSIVDESFPVHHAGVSTTAPSAGSPRLSILHAWIWTPNPDGVFKTENWTLPLARLGTNARDVGGDALRGIALALDGTGYYELMLRTGLALDDGDARTVETIVRTRRRQAQRLLAQRGISAASTIAVEWESLWADLQRALPGRSTRLREVRTRL